MSYLQPTPTHRFALGLGTSGRGSRNEPAGPPVQPWDMVYGLYDAGLWGVGLHDDALVPPGGPAQEWEGNQAKFRAALDTTGLVLSMVTTDLSRHSAFRGGAFAAVDRDVRRYAIQKAMRGIDLGAELGAAIHGLGCGPPARAIPGALPTDALDRCREAVEFLVGYIREQGYATRLALQPGDACGNGVLPTIGHALAFIDTLDDAELVGVGVGSAAGGGLTDGIDGYWGVAQAAWSGRLLHVDLGARLPGSAAATDSLLVTKLLDEAGYDRPLHFAVPPHLLDDADRARSFAIGWVHAYLVLAAKARRFAYDPDIQEALADAGALELAEPTIGPYSREAAQELTEQAIDPDKLTERGYRTDRLDLLVSDLLLGVR
jgi:xylose isomerase